MQVGKQLSIGGLLQPGEPRGLRRVATRYPAERPRVQGGEQFTVRTDVEPQNGDTVVMRVNLDGEVTCKRFYRREGTIVLQPENPAFEPMVIGVANPGEVHVIGKVIGLYRRME
jgi:SOS-response transcriptional repressor LexA